MNVPRWLMSLVVALLFVLQAAVVSAQIPEETEPVDESESTEQVVDAVEGPGGPDEEIVDPDETEETEEPEESPPPEDEESESPEESDEAHADEDEADEAAKDLVENVTGGGLTAPTTAKPANDAIGAQASGQTDSYETSTIEGKSPGASVSTGADGGAKFAHTIDSISYLSFRIRSQPRVRATASGLAGSAQPSLAMLIDAVNDADGDGNFSDVETASAPGTDVRFKALISNIGATPFEVSTVNHSYVASTGRVRVRICEDVITLVVAPGQSVPCAFSLADYSPPRGQGLLNTVTAAGFSIGNSRRGVSDSDSSTVDTAPSKLLTLVADRKPKLLAFTGTDPARLVAAALVLIATGGWLVTRARRRRKSPRVSNARHGNMWNGHAPDGEATRAETASDWTR